MKSPGWQLLQVRSIIQQPTHWASSSCYLISYCLPITATVLPPVCCQSISLPCNISKSNWAVLTISWELQEWNQRYLMENIDWILGFFWTRHSVCWDEGFNLNHLIKGRIWIQFLKLLCVLGWIGCFSFVCFVLVLICLFFPKGIFLHPVTQVNLSIIICEGKTLF